jgi:hypothetical protein
MNSLNCASLTCDDDYVQIDTIQSVSPFEYHVVENYHKNHEHPDHVENATNQATINFMDGYGIHPNFIDDEDKTGKVQVFNRDANQLFTRPFLTIPYMGRGVHNVDNESDLISGEDTFQSKSTNSLAGVHLENQFTPLLGHIEETIQNPIHLIPEDNNSNWIRGGIDTSQLRKDFDYFEKCNDSDEIKNQLVEKKSYLKNKLVPME